MTILECITQVDTLKSNTFSVTEKIRWLNELDGRIKTELVDTHEGGCDCQFVGYTEADDQAELIAMAPHDSIYIRWLEAQIDYYNGDLRRYSNSIIMFNETYAEFASWYNRTHRPKTAKMIYF